MQVPFAAGYHLSVQPARHPNLDALAAEALGEFDGLTHGTPEADALFDLYGHRLGHQLSVQLGPVDLLDVDVDVALGRLLQLGLELLDL